MLEECAIPYRVIPVDTGAGQQFSSAFAAITPNHQLPAIVDPNGSDGQPHAGLCSTKTPAQ